ncbi:MAG: DoxX family membrane protein [Thermoguttaceae bacterium]
MLVVLRLSLGCHFLYEGVWKIANPGFSAEPFLAQAKGPAAPLFYKMLDDIDGRKRLRLETDPQGNPVLGPKGRPVVRAPSTLEGWQALKNRVIHNYGLTEPQAAAAEKLYKRYEASLAEYLDENAEEIAGYFGALGRFQQERASGGNDAPYYRKRVWDRQQELRRQVHVWLSHIDALGEQFKAGLWNLLDENQQAQGFFKSSWNPLEWSRGQQITFAVTYGLTAIGLCLMLGLFTRLAALAGAAFMAFVVLSQPSWPGIYPPPGYEMGHALIIDKNFIEMVALLLVATTRAGRWGGLDLLVHHGLVRPLLSRKRNQQDQDQP